MILEYQKNWERIRTDINHNWLSNIYLRQIQALKKYLEISFSNNDMNFMQEIEQINGNILPQWLEKRVFVVNLVQTLEIELSPKNAFSISPLSKIENSRTWLVDLTHRIWDYQNNVQELVLELKDIISYVDKKYILVENSLNNYIINKIDKDLSIIDIVNEYLDYCTKLSYKLSFCTKVQRII